MTEQLSTAYWLNQPRAHSDILAWDISWTEEPGGLKELDTT